MASWGARAELQGASSLASGAWEGDRQVQALKSSKDEARERNKSRNRGREYGD